MTTAIPVTDGAAAGGHKPLLEMVGVSKSFPGVIANDDVSLRVMPGEIHAILGENGAGKSTLMKLIYGVIAPDRGELRWKGERVEIANPAHARSLGIGMVFQHFSLLESLTVAENISLATPHRARALEGRISEIGERFGLPVDPRALVHSLSVGQRQRAEIIRCLLQEPRLIIMDEPTSVLPPTGIPALFETIRTLASQGCAVLFISHKLEEIRALCHKATVMRAGKVVATVDPTLETSEALARAMIGREVPTAPRTPPRPAAIPALRVERLDYRPEDPFGTALQGIELAVHPGEIVGIAGVSGNGQRELSAALSGEARLPSRERDRVIIDNTPCGDFGPGARRRLGLAFVPEERNGRGAVPEMSLVKNSLLTAHHLGMVRRGVIAFGQARAFAERCITEMDVRCNGASAEAHSLSGGNLQKFIVGREIRLNPRVLVVSQPTWGVDVGAAASIRRQLIELRDGGAAILVISDELDELFETADRIHVLFRGRLSPSLARQEADTAVIGSYMTGDFLRHADAPRGDAGMIHLPFTVETRLNRTSRLAFVAPVAAIVVTVLIGTMVMDVLGVPPVRALYYLYLAPFSSRFNFGEVLLNMTPLLLIAQALAIGFRAKVWNIGAEGQLLLGAIGGSLLPIYFNNSDSALMLPAMALIGMCFGMAWAAVAAWLRTRFNANEILVTLMLNSIALQLLYYLVSGPLRDPGGFNFPQSVLFPDAAMLPLILSGTRANVSLFLGLTATVLAWFFVERSMMGYKLEVGGTAPSAARYAGFSDAHAVWLSLLIGGAAAGLAGTFEVAGPLGQLQRVVSPGYGFAAIIVAFLGGLNAVGILFAAFFMAIIFVGGDIAQTAAGVPYSVNTMLQGLLLVAYIAARLFVDYRVRWRSSPRAGEARG